MARSIAALGLIHPIVIDTRDVIIAGSHRYAALLVLAAAAEERETLLARLCTVKSGDLDVVQAMLRNLPASTEEVRWHAIPVRVMPLSVAEDPDGAWRVEVAENERRRDYSAGEVRMLAKRLRAQGYRMDPGRSRTGELLGMPLLTTIIGRSERTVRRLLTSAAAETRPDGREQAEKNRQAAFKALNRYKTQHATEMTDDQQRVLEKALRVLDALAQ